MLSDVDLLARLERTETSVGEIVYPPGGRLGPAWQSSIELVLIHTGSVRVSVGDEPTLMIPAGWLALRVPHRVERYAFDDAVSTHHTWVKLRIEEWPTPMLDRVGALVPMLPISNAMADVVAAAVSEARTPLSTVDPLLAALAAAAIWRYVGEAESSVRGSDDAVALAQRFLHTHLDG